MSWGGFFSKCDPKKRSVDSTTDLPSLLDIRCKVKQFAQNFSIIDILMDF